VGIQETHLRPLLLIILLLLHPLPAEILLGITPEIGLGLLAVISKSMISVAYKLTQQVVGLDVNLLRAVPTSLGLLLTTAG
jgi:hypothetical protein